MSPPFNGASEEMVSEAGLRPDTRPKRRHDDPVQKIDVADTDSVQKRKPMRLLLEDQFDLSRLAGGVLALKTSELAKRCARLLAD